VITGAAAIVCVVAIELCLGFDAQKEESKK
jgi:hypothetical protein